MSTLAPRTIAVHRSNGASSTAVGLGSYSGREITVSPGETVLFTGIPAAISAKSTRRTGTAMPSDGQVSSEWLVAIPASALPIYSIRDEDIIVDDEGYRYLVQQNAYNLGYQLICSRSEI